MSDDLVQYLLAGRSSQVSLDADTLKLMGKQAAAKFLNEGVPLTEAVTKLASETSGIQVEHINRICEFANLEVNARVFEKGAAENKGGLVYPSFTPADPAKVVQQLSDGTKLAHVIISAPEYDHAPQDLFKDDGYAVLEQAFLGHLMEKAALAGTGKAEFSHPVTSKGVVLKAPMDLAGNKTGYLPSPSFLTEFIGEDKSQITDIDTHKEHPDVRADIQQAVSPTGLPGHAASEDGTKTASAVLNRAYPYENPYHEVISLRTTIEGQKEALASQYNFMDLRARQAWSDFFGHVKEAVAGGVSFGDISGACFSICDGNEQVHHDTMAPVIGGLVQQKVASAQAITEQLSKTASVARIPNPESPLVSSYAAFLEFATEREKIAAAWRQLDAHFKEIDEFLRGQLAATGS